MFFLILGCFAPATHIIDFYNQYPLSYHSLPIASGLVAGMKSETLTLNTSSTPTWELQDWRFDDIVQRLQCHLWIGDSASKPFPPGAGLPDPSLFFTRGSQSDPMAKLPFTNASALLLYGPGDTVSIIAAVLAIITESDFPLNDTAALAATYRADDCFVQDYEGQLPYPNDLTMGIPRSGYAGISCPRLCPDPREGPTTLPGPLHPLIGEANRKSIPEDTHWNPDKIHCQVPPTLRRAVKEAVKRIVTKVRHKFDKLRCKPFSNGFISLRHALDLLHHNELPMWEGRRTSA